MLARGAGDAFLMTRSRWDGDSRRRRVDPRSRHSDSDDSDAPVPPDISGKRRFSVSKTGTPSRRLDIGSYRSASVGPRHGYERSSTADEFLMGYQQTISHQHLVSGMEPHVTRLSTPPREVYRDASPGKDYFTPRFSHNSRSRKNSREDILSTSPAIDPRLSAFFTDKKTSSFSRVAGSDVSDRTGRRRARRTQKSTVVVSGDEDDNSPAAYPVMSADWGGSLPRRRSRAGQPAAAEPTPRRISGRLARQSLASQVFSTPDLSRADELVPTQAEDPGGGLSGSRGRLDLFSPRDGDRASPRVNRRDLDEILQRAAQRRQTRLSSRPPVSARDLFASSDTSARRVVNGNLPPEPGSDRSSDTPEPPAELASVRGRGAPRTRRDSGGSEISAGQSVSSERSSRSGRDSTAPEQRESLSTRYQRLRQQSGSVASQNSESSGRKSRKSSRGRLLDVRSPELENEFEEEEPVKDVGLEPAPRSYTKPAIPPKPPVPAYRPSPVVKDEDRSAQDAPPRTISGRLSRQSRACVFSSPDLSRTADVDDAPVSWGRTVRDVRTASSRELDVSSPPTEDASAVGTGEEVVRDRPRIPTGRRPRPKPIISARKSLDSDMVLDDSPAAGVNSRVPSADTASLQDFPVSRRREIPSPWSRVGAQSPATSEASSDYPVIRQRKLRSKLQSAVPDVLADLSSAQARVMSPISVGSSSPTAHNCRMEDPAGDAKPGLSGNIPVQAAAAKDVDVSEGDLSIAERLALIKQRQGSLSGAEPAVNTGPDNGENVPSSLQAADVSTPTEVGRGATLPRSFRLGARSATRSPATPAATSTPVAAAVTPRRPRSLLRRRAASQSGSPDRMSVISTGSERALDRRGRSRSPRCRIAQLRLKPRRVSQSPDARRSSLVSGARFSQSVNDLRGIGSPGLAATPSQDDIWHSVLRAAGVEAGSDAGQPTATLAGRDATPADDLWIPQPWSGAGPPPGKPSPLTSPTAETAPVRPPRKKKAPGAAAGSTVSGRRLVDENWNRIGDGGSSESGTRSESCESSVPPSEAAGVACLTKPAKSPPEPAPEEGIGATVVLQLADISGFLQDTRTDDQQEEDAVAEDDDEGREIESLTEASSVDLELELGLELELESASAQPEQEPAVARQPSSVKQNLIAFSPGKDADQEDPVTSAPLAAAADNSAAAAPPEATTQDDELKQKLSLQHQLLTRDMAITTMKNKLTELEKQLAKCKQSLEVEQAALSYLASSKERQCCLLTEGMRELKSERDEAREEVANIEAMFADLHRKYEKSKLVVADHRQRGEQLSATLRDREEQLSRETARYDLLQKHAEDAMERLRADQEVLAKGLETENLRLTMKLKLSDNRVSKLEDDNRQLTAMCDELIQKMGDPR